MIYKYQDVPLFTWEPKSRNQISSLPDLPRPAPFDEVHQDQ